MIGDNSNIAQLAMRVFTQTKCRIVIAGMPLAGKSTLAQEFGDALGVRVQATDELKDMEWQAASRKAVEWMEATGPWIIEGVTMGRALRKWGDQNKSAPSSKRPCDIIIWRAHDMSHLTDPQANMAKGCKTVWEQALPVMHRRGVHIWDL